MKLADHGHCLKAVKVKRFLRQQRSSCGSVASLLVVTGWSAGYVVLEWECNAERKFLRGGRWESLRYTG